MNNQCVHEVDAKDTTLVMLRKAVMSYPPMREGYCKCCGKTFRFTKDKMGRFTQPV